MHAAADDDLRSLYEGSYPRLVSQLFAVTGDFGAAQDAVQEAFVRAINSPKRFASVDNPEAWLLRVALNVARSRWQRLRRGEALIRLSRYATPGPRDAPGLSPDRVAVVAALRELPSAHRECLALHHLVDLSIAEIARTIGVPQGTVKARLSRGRQRLSQLLADEPEWSDHA